MTKEEIKVEIDKHFDAISNLRDQLRKTEYWKHETVYDEDCPCQTEERTPLIDIDLDNVYIPRH